MHTYDKNVEGKYWSKKGNKDQGGWTRENYDTRQVITGVTYLFMYEYICEEYKCTYIIWSLTHIISIGRGTIVFGEKNRIN